MDPAAIISGTTPETPVPATEVKVEPPKHTPVSPQLGILARKEKALVQKQREMQEKEKEWGTKASKLSEYEAKEKLWRENPRKALEEYGHSYQSLTEQVLADGDLTPEKIDALVEKKLEARTKQEQEQKAKEAEEESKQLTEKEQQAEIAFKGQLQTFIKEKAEEFPLLDLLGSDAELVYDVMDEYYRNGNKKQGIPPGKVLSKEEAAGMVEKFFMQQVEAANERLKPKAPKKEGEEKHVPDGITPQTLTNSLTGTMPSTLPAKNEADRIARAMAALDGKK